MKSIMRNGLAGIVLSGMLAGCGGRAISSSGPSSGDGILALGFRTLGGLQDDPRRALLGDTLSYTIGRESDRRMHESLQDNKPDYTIQNNNQFVEQPRTTYDNDPEEVIISRLGGFSRKDPVYEIIVVCTAQRIEDRNNDRSNMFPDEFVGLATQFPEGTPFNLYFLTKREIKNPDQIRLRLVKMSPTNSAEWAEWVKVGDSCGPYGIEVRYNSFGNQSLGPGIYHADWFVENRCDQLVFEVTDKR